MKKYVLFEENDGAYYRIKALRDVGTDVKAGDLGGWVSGEWNLSQEGECWIYDEAEAMDNSRVYMNAQLRKNAFVGGNAEIRGTALVTDIGIVRGSAVVCMSAVVKDGGIVEGSVYLYGAAVVDGKNVCCYGRLNKKLESTEELLYHSFGVVTVGGKTVLYKNVWSTDAKDVFISNWDSKFKYTVGKISKVKNYDADPKIYYGRGIHLTGIKDASFYGQGNAVIACEVNVKDVVAVGEGIARVKKCKTIGVVDYPGRTTV